MGDILTSTDEQALWSGLANRTQNAFRSVGGKLFLTSRKLSFVAHQFDTNFWGTNWSVEIHEIKAIGLQPIDLKDLFGGGLRKRLRVELADGSVEYFVVNQLDKVLVLLRQHIC
ncbi:hypothetical protein [Tumebacillus permanentifrigoris]|uniref:PH (Pleckstrin Homology) domain-containing protein n=1 Tax=Tumebacillus permanentifrigoris TaxID=378543 RepID=A0A316D8P6_9BACL|nr:hypothetical protein [Tumebacillus permanentifrigoris]PWK13352.1 hypothetical protein C7459_10718 [Tumebacillus permanentifrigoris]